MKPITLRILLILAGFLLLATPQLVQAADSALGGTSWVLSSLNGQLPLPGTTVTLQFGDDGSRHRHRRLQPLQHHLHGQPVDHQL